MARRATVRVTANFEANLVAIQAFWKGAGAPEAYDRLIGDLTNTVVGNLERHPTIGRPFLDRNALSIEARDRIARLKKRVDAGALREYLSGDYLILYTVVASTVYLLSIKHHRQLSFAFGQLWE